MILQSRSLSCSFCCFFFSSSSLLCPCPISVTPLSLESVSLSSKKWILKLYSLTLSVSSYVKTSEKLGEWNDKVTQSDLWVPRAPQHHLPVPFCLPWSVLLLALPGIRACLGAGGRVKQDCYFQHAWLPARNISPLQRRWVNVSAIISVMVLLLQKKNSNQLPDHILY